MAILIQNGRAVDFGGLNAMRDLAAELPAVRSVLYDQNIANMAHAERLAAELNDIEDMPLVLAVDRGRWVSPRYSVTKAPKLGDDVSYGFNGDYYPDGYVAHVTKGTARVVKTTGGGVYYRRGLTERWIKKGGTWGLVPGHRSERNPSF